MSGVWNVSDKVCAYENIRVHAYIYIYIYTYKYIKRIYAYLIHYQIYDAPHTP